MYRSSSLIIELQNAKWAEGDFDTIFIRPTFRPFRRPASFRAGETLVCFQANKK